MHEVDPSYYIRSTWCLYRLASNVPFIARVTNSLSTFVYYLELSNFLSEFHLSVSCLSVL